MNLVSFSFKIGFFPPPSIKNYPLESIYNNFPDITAVRLRGLQVPSSRIGFVREMIISCYKFRYSQADKV